MEPRRLWSFLFLFPFQAAEGAKHTGLRCHSGRVCPQTLFPSHGLAGLRDPWAAVLRQRVLPHWSISSDRVGKLSVT